MELHSPRERVWGEARLLEPDDVAINTARKGNAQRLPAQLNSSGAAEPWTEPTNGGPSVRPGSPRRPPAFPLSSWILGRRLISWDPSRVMAGLGEDRNLRTGDFSSLRGRSMSDQKRRWTEHFPKSWSCWWLRSATCLQAIWVLHLVYPRMVSRWHWSRKVASHPPGWIISLVAELSPGWFFFKTLSDCGKTHITQIEHIALHCQGFPGSSAGKESTILTLLRIQCNSIKYQRKYL